MIIYGYPEAAPYVPNKTNSHIAVETLAAPIKIQMGAVLINPRKGPLTLAGGVGCGT